jgi:hypothetical protein
MFPFPKAYRNEQHIAPSRMLTFILETQQPNDLECDFYDQESNVQNTLKQEKTHLVSKKNLNDKIFS